MHNANATRQNMMGGNPKVNNMIKPRDGGKPEAEPRHKPQITNNIFNPQMQQPVQHQQNMGYKMMQQPMMQQQMMQPQIMQPQMMQIQQHPQLGMNVMQMPQTQYGAPKQQQQWKMM